jgi:hypothetical protein
MHVAVDRENADIRMALIWISFGVLLIMTLIAVLAKTFEKAIESPHMLQGQRGIGGNKYMIHYILALSFAGVCTTMFSM